MTRKISIGQLDLLDMLAEIEARPAVVRLPASAWGGSIWRCRVAEIANSIATATDPARRARYLPGACGILGRELRAAGATEAEVLGELAKYRTAVMIELGRRRGGALPIRAPAPP